MGRLSVAATQYGPGFVSLANAAGRASVHKIVDQICSNRKEAAEVATELQYFSMI
jgi:hypothetical protein